MGKSNAFHMPLFLLEVFFSFVANDAFYTFHCLPVKLIFILILSYGQEVCQGSPTRFQSGQFAFCYCCLNSDCVRNNDEYIYTHMKESQNDPEMVFLFGRHVVGNGFHFNKI